MHLKIALLAGDGIGPEVIEQAVKVSDAIATKFNHTIEWTPALTGAAAIDAVKDAPEKILPRGGRIVSLPLPPHAPGRAAASAR